MLEEVYRLAPEYVPANNNLLTNIMVRVLESDWSTKIDPILTQNGFIGIGQTRVVATDMNDNPVNMLDAEYVVNSQNITTSPATTLWFLLGSVDTPFIIAFSICKQVKALTVPVSQGTLPTGSNPTLNPFTFHGFNPKFNPQPTDTIVVWTLYPTYPLSDAIGPYSSIVESFYTISDIGNRTAAVGYISLHSDGNFLYTPTGEQLVNSLEQTASPTIWRISTDAVTALINPTPSLTTNADNVIALITLFIRLYGKSSITAGTVQGMINHTSLYNQVLSLLSNSPVSDSDLNTAMASVAVPSE